ncbi:ThuA domain-containing protein [Jeotgalibacillus proteolyticus]|uniref:Trehalose utilization n=1 Tax=Jeotgalibacillus proteolyticus TaxID=2082395 RepID=A0A2S5G7Z9_9BACL|nr:ThuA domain-containing protein [Jeotgalibacillus proteolyticus]PPA69116.1 trehalose utilization [Jeotgalibacillus proteolyticus]
MTKRIVAVLGDFYHKKDNLIKSMELGLKRAEAEVEVEYSTARELSDQLKSLPDAVILSTENRLNPEDDNVETWMDERVAKEISDYVKNGGSWLAWHSGLASYDDLTDYTDMLRGHFKFHPKEHQEVTYFPEQGTAYESLSTFILVDEHYFVHCDDNHEGIFMRSESIDGSSIAGWSHTYGKGKVVCLTPAHNEAGLADAAFIDVLRKSLIELL